MHLRERVYGAANIPKARPAAVQRAGCRTFRGLHPDIDIEGSSHVAMSGQCMGADNEVLNPLVAKGSQNLDKMRIHPVPFH